LDRRSSAFAGFLWVTKLQETASRPAENLQI